MYQRKSIFSVFILLFLSLTFFFSSNIQAAASAYSRIEAESFSSQSGIQLETCSDSGAGQDIGYIQNGDYVVFSGIDFGSGAASFSARIASANSGGNIEIHLDSLSGTLIGTCTVPGTGGWQSWVTQTCNVSGATGVHDVYLKFTGGSQDLMNLNWFQFLAVPKVSAYVQIEAENFTGQSGIQTESCSDTGAGQNIGYIVNGDYTVYSNIDFGSGATSFSARVASANSGGNIEIHLDSLSGTLVGTCVVSGTGGWQTWVTQTCSISGATGVHDVYLKYVGSAQDLMNVNWFRFASNGTSAFGQIQAENFSSQLGIQTQTCSDTDGGVNISYIENGDYAVYTGIDFGSGAAGFAVRVASANTSGGSIEIHLDSLSGTLVGTCAVPVTGGWQTWVTDTCSVSGASGIHDVYLKFTGGSNGLMNVNWFQFTTTPPSTGKHMEIMTWVPAYSQNVWKSALQADTGGSYNPRNTLTRVAAQYFLVEYNGSVSTIGSSSDLQWVANYCKTNGIKFLLCIFNNDGSSAYGGWNWARAASGFGTNKTALINNLITLVNQWGADGVDIDFEGNLDGDPNRSEFASFIKDLGTRLHGMNKELTVDVFPDEWNQPNTKWWPDWVGYVDGVNSMGYDWLYGGGPGEQSYQWQQNTALNAGYQNYQFEMGMPGWAGSWGSGGLGSGVLAHVNELLSGNYNRLPTSVCIWDAQFNGSGWLSAEVWNGLHTIKMTQGN